MAYLNPIPLFAPTFNNPNDITGLKLWLKADAGVYHDAGTTLATDGQTVRQWNDQSANVKNATQSSAGLRPTFRANVGGNPALQFSSSQMVVGANGDFVDTAFSVFAVINWTGNTAPQFQAIMNKGDGISAANSVWELMVAESTFPANTWGSVRFDTFHGSTNNNDLQMGQLAGQNALITGIRVSNSVKHGYSNGNLVSTGGDSGNALNAGATLLGIGSDGSSGTVLPYTSYIRELLYYNNALSDTNRTLVEGYLRSKYAISLPTVPIMASFNQADGISADREYVVQTIDALNWTTPAGVTNPTFIPFGPAGVGTSAGTSGTSLLLHNGTYYWAYEYNNVAAAVKAFGIATSASLAGPWTWLTDVNVLASTVNGYVWNPRWFIDDDASIHIICNACNSANLPIATLPMQPFILDALNSGLTSWSAATAITGSGGFPPAICIDFFCVPPSKSPNGKYNLFYKNETTVRIDYATSSSLKSGYTPTVTNVFGVEAEGTYVIKLGSTWRAYASIPSGGVWSYFDSLDNWATWSTLPTNVVGPVLLGGQWLLTTG